MRKVALISLLFLFALLHSAGQGIEVTAKFDTTNIYIGDQVYFTVKMEKPEDAQISFPVFKDTLYKKIEILSGPLTDTLPTLNGRNGIIQKYLVTSFDSGVFRVPPFYAEQTLASSLKRYYSDYSVLTVSRVKVTPQDTTDVIYDIIKPYKAPLTIGEILPWLLLLLALSAAAWYLVRFLKNRKKSKAGVETPAFIEPAHVIAFRELENLKAEELWQKGELKLYYTRLTEILRQYLENRYKIMSLELTTEETLSIYKKSVKPDNVIFNSLKLILINADLVKFAKFKPEAPDNESAFENSWSFVSLTQEKPELDKEMTEDKKVSKKEEAK